MRRNDQQGDDDSPQTQKQADRHSKRHRLFILQKPAVFLRFRLDDGAPAILERSAPSLLGGVLYLQGEHEESRIFYCFNCQNWPFGPNFFQI